jgi:hypothetical protein
METHYDPHLLAETKSWEYQIRSIYKLSTVEFAQFRQEINQLIEAQIKLYLVYPHLPKSSAYINRLLRKIFKLGKDLPLFDVSGRKAYLDELESEIKTLNQTSGKSDEQTASLKRSYELDLLREYNSNIIELFKVDRTTEEKPSAQFATDCLSATVLHAALSNKIKAYYEKNKALKKEKSDESLAVKIEAENPQPLALPCKI